MPQRLKKKHILWIAVGLCAAVVIAVVLTALLRPTPEGEQQSFVDKVISVIRPTKPTSQPTQPTVPKLPANPYGPEDFAYDGEFLECLTGSSKVGIDVSYYQGDVDWHKVKEAGVEFVFVRLGYRSMKEGLLNEDICAQNNLKGAREAGLQVGAYFFSQALNAREAEEEAVYAMQILNGYELDLPLVYDWEFINETARTANMDKATLMECVKAFCETVEKAGRKPMVYFNRNMAANYLDMAELTAYPFWLAMYTDKMTYPNRVHFWQYSDKGRVPGIKGYVDLDVWMTDLEHPFLTVG